MLKKSGWKEIKRDVPDCMIKAYRDDLHVYKIKDMNQDVDWRFCVHHETEGSSKGKNCRTGLLRHVNPFARLPELITKRDTAGCYVSKEFGDHKKDWDFIVKYRDRVFRKKEFNNEFHKGTTTFDKVKAIADDLVANYKTSGGEYLHPVDTLINGAWCTGVSAVMVAVAHTMGLEARTIVLWGHTIAEVKIDGNWCVCENIYKKENTEFVHLINRSWMEIMADPYSCKELPEAQKRYYLKKKDYMYVFSIGTHWHMHTIGTYVWIRLTPYTAKALYPELDRFYLRTQKNGAKEFWLWSGINWDKGIGWDTLRYQKVKQGQGIRKIFYLADLKEVTGINSYITFVKNNNISTCGNAWYFRVNGGRKHYLKNTRCWWKYSGDVLFHDFPWWERLNKLSRIARRNHIKLIGKDTYLETKNRIELGWKWHGG